MENTQETVPDTNQQASDDMPEIDLDVVLVDSPATTSSPNKSSPQPLRKTPQKLIGEADELFQKTASSIHEEDASSGEEEANGGPTTPPNHFLVKAALAIDELDEMVEAVADDTASCGFDDGVLEALMEQQMETTPKEQVQATAISTLRRKFMLLLLLVVFTFALLFAMQTVAYETELNKWKVKCHGLEDQLQMERKLREAQTEQAHAVYIAALREKHVLEMHEYPFRQHEFSSAWWRWMLNQAKDLSNTMDDVVEQFGQAIVSYASPFKA
jgi:hypothetical protein